MKKLLFLTAIVFFAIQSQASHLMGMDMVYECIGNNQYRFTLDIYRDCAGINAPTATTIQATSSCGNMSISMAEVDLSPNDPNSMGIEVPMLTNPSASSCQGGVMVGVMHHRYQGVGTFAQCSDWVVTWNSCCRPAAVAAGGSNVVNPNTQSMTVEVSFDNSVHACLNSPIFVNYPVFVACNNYPYVYQQGAIDMDGDSLVFSLMDAYGSPGIPLPYNPGYSGSSPITGNSLMDPSNGDLFLHPTLDIAAIIAVRVEEYRNGQLISTVMRDMQMVVDPNCGNLTLPRTGVISNLTGGAVANSANEITVPANEPFSMTITTVDTTNNNNVVLSGHFNQYISNDWVMVDSSQFSNVEGKILQSTFSWTPSTADIGTHEFENEIYSKTATPYWYFFQTPITVNVVENTTSNSVSENLSNLVKWHPNPASDVLFVTLDERLRNANIDILDITGKRYSSYQVQSQQANIPLELPVGVYVLRIQADGKQMIEKLVIE